MQTRNGVGGHSVVRRALRRRGRGRRKMNRFWPRFIGYAALIAIYFLGVCGAISVIDDRIDAIQKTNHNCEKNHVE